MISFGHLRLINNEAALSLRRIFLGEAFSNSFTVVVAYLHASIRKASRIDRSYLHACWTVLRPSIMSGSPRHSVPRTQMFVSSLSQQVRVEDAQHAPPSRYPPRGAAWYWLMPLHTTCALRVLCSNFPQKPDLQETPEEIRISYP